MYYNDYHVEDSDDSDGYDSSSSEDAFESYVRKTYLSKNEPQDDFEKEMEDELTETLKAFERKQILCSVDPEQKAKAAASSSQTPKERKEVGKLGSTKVNNKADDSKAGDKRADDSKADTKKADNGAPSNDDLLYDPNMDDEDEKWVNEQRHACIFPAATSSKEKPGVRPLPNSDAVLNCPACMTLLCLDCQRHAIYNTQYRAMFVKNCIVNDKEVLRCPLSKSSATRRRGGTDDPCDLFHPVRCRVCSTEVAVRDREEVFHFFNVIASFS